MILFTPELQFTGNLLLMVFIIVLDGLAKDVQPQVHLAPGAQGGGREQCNSPATTALGRVRNRVRQ